MLGLKRGAVALSDHDPRWAEAFAHERREIERALDGLGCGIEHIGSTAVAGLMAKPVLDIAVGWPPGASPEICIARLQAAGYAYRGDDGDEGGYVLVKGPKECRTLHLHLVEKDDRQWNEYLAFRNVLRTDQAARDAYASLKRKLAEQYPHDRNAYTDGKREIVESFLIRATQRPEQRFVDRR